MAFVGAGLRIEHHDAAVGVTVRRIDFLRLHVDRDVGRRAERGRVIAASDRTGFADLQRELAVHREFEQLAIELAVACKPDKIIVVDENTVLALRPLVTLPRPTPGAQQIAGLVEHEHRRRCKAALGSGRRLRRCKLAFIERPRSMDDPDAVEPVNRDPRDLPENPVIG